MEYDKFEDFNYKTNGGKPAPAQAVTDIGETTAIGLYRQLVRLRVVEKSLVKEYHPADEMKCPQCPQHIGELGGLSDL